MSDGMGREFTYLSSHATNRYFIPNWGICLYLNGLPCFQKDSFCTLKGLLLLSKRTPFATQNEPFCNPKGLLLKSDGNLRDKGKGKRGKINWIFYTLQNKNDTNPRLPPCPCRSY